MMASPFTHCALLVQDLEIAVANLTNRLGVTFTEHQTTHVEDLRDSAGRRSTTVRYAYSNIGAPYYELIEAQDDGIYGRQQGLGLHHVGMWEDDCQARFDTLVSAGLEVDAVSYSSTGEIVVAYFKPAGLSGLRVEILDVAMRPTIVALTEAGIGD
jgi:hypothetical protein